MMVTNSICAVYTEKCGRKVTIESVATLYAYTARNVYYILS